MIFYCDFIFYSNRFEERGQEKRRGCVRLQHIVLISVLSILLYLTSCTKYSQSVSVYKSLAYSTYASISHYSEQRGQWRDKRSSFYCKY